VLNLVIKLHITFTSIICMLTSSALPQVITATYLKSGWCGFRTSQY